MKKIFEDIAKESTKEQFASKSTGFEVINKIAFLCKSLEERMQKEVMILISLVSTIHAQAAFMVAQVMCIP